MKVTGVRVTPQTFFLARRMGSAQTPQGRLTDDACIVELMTDSGLTGISIGAQKTRPQIESLVQDMLVGADPRRVTGIWQQMTDVPSARRRGRLFNQVIAALDVALWDLKAKANDEPLWKTLGGTRPKANAYASGIDLPLSDEDLSGWYALMARDYGLRGGKLQVGLDQERDLRRLERMRSALLHATAEPVLSIDADQHWSPKQAMRRVRAMEEHFDLSWVEGASAGADFSGLKQISNAICGAVCVGDGLATLADFLPHFRHRSADVIQIDVGAVGITAALQLADAAFGFELPVTLSAAPGNIHAHLCGVMPYFMSMEVVDPISTTPTYTSDVRIEQGWAVVGDAPGNGLVLNSDALVRPVTRASG